MHTVYVDDSGTHNEAKVAAAACCVSAAKPWKRYEREWRVIEAAEQFQHFHMSAFAACKPGVWCRDCQIYKTSEEDHPWREWSMTKRRRVLKALVEVVCEYVEAGVGWAMIKTDYNEVVPPLLRKHAGVSCSRLAPTAIIGSRVTSENSA